MTRAELSWFGLRFPHDLTDDAVLAALSALSGLAHPAQIVLSLHADMNGLHHRLGVRPAATDAAVGSLRAAIPSLHLDASGPPPKRPQSQRWLWQLAPRVAALRTDQLGASTASLLMAFVGLGADEAVTLTWTLTPAPRPSAPDSEAPDEGRVLRAKLASPGFAALGELTVSAPTPIRRRQLMQRPAAVLRSLSTPHGRLLSDAPWYSHLAWALAQRGRFLSVPELAAVIGWPIGGPDLPGLSLGASRRLVPSDDLPRTGRVLGTSDYAGVTRPVALTPAASTRGLYLLGPTGTGKTSLLKNLIASDLEQGRGLVVVETNGDLIHDLTDLIPPHRVGDVILLDPLDPSHAVGFNPLAGADDPALVADQLGELFARLWASSWGPRTAQLTHMGLLTLARRGGSTLLDLPRLFLDAPFRAGVLRDLDDPVGLGPDWQWFEGLSERERSTVVAPLLNKVRAFTARPAIRAILGQAEPRLQLAEVISEQRVMLVNLPKGLLGTETAQLLGCLILIATWQAFTRRAALPPAARHPFGLYVDEVQDFAAAPVPWDELFAQGRKYGLMLTAAHQNLTQLPKDVREVILANARSKVVFALSGVDAKKLERLFAPALSASDLQALDPYAVAALVALDNGGTARPVTLQTPPPLPGRGSRSDVQLASRQRYARPRAEIEAGQRARFTDRQRPAGPVGRRRRERP